MLYDYNSGLKQIFNRKGSYLPGMIAKSGWKQVDAVNSYANGTPIEFGQVLKRVVDQTTRVPVVTAIEEDDPYNVFFGVAVRDVISQSDVNFNSTNANIVTHYISGQPISVMREGYIAVPVQQGTPIAGNPVYVRVAPSATNPALPLGGIEAFADVGNVAWKNVVFESDGYYALEGTNVLTNTNGITSQCATIKIMRADYNALPHIVSAPTATAAAYGTKMSELVLTGGSATYNKEAVDGKFIMNNPDYMPKVGTHTYTATFMPADLDKFDPVTNVEVVVTITAVTPTNTDKYETAH